MIRTTNRVRKSLREEVLMNFSAGESAATHSPRPFNEPDLFDCDLKERGK